MAADLDVLIYSPSDPMVAFVYHRHFTHSLAFVPIGGLLCALPWIVRRHPRSREIAAATTIGYATHAPLDAFTSYGTMLWWPFSQARVALDWVAIIDPIYTLVLALGLTLAIRLRRRRPAALALVASSLYLAFGALQHARAIASTAALARARGHVPARIRALPPTPSNLVWRTLYRADGRIHVDGARTPWIGATRSRGGDSVLAFDEGDLPPEVAADARTLAAFRRFAWFADGWVARGAVDPADVVDLRYAVDVLSIDALWGVRLRPGADRPVERVTFRGSPGDAARAQWRALSGDWPG
jgi:inner membrane protein